MATPQVSVTISSVDESTKTIYYTISYSADYDPEANEANYRNGVVGYRYINKQSDGSTSYQTEYDSGYSSKTITISYTYNVRYVKRTQTGKVYEKLFNTNAEASNYVNGQANPEDYSIELGAAGYAVYKITYTYTVATNPTIQQGSASATASFTPKNQKFQWTTNIYEGAKMNSWQNPTNGLIHPAPVTAVEWNSLVALVNLKCGTNIATVSRGTKMSAANGGNVRQVADALRISVNSKDRITAQFFYDLRDAVNAL